MIIKLLEDGVIDGKLRGKGEIFRTNHCDVGHMIIKNNITIKRKQTYSKLIIDEKIKLQKEKKEKADREKQDKLDKEKEDKHAKTK